MSKEAFVKARERMELSTDELAKKLDVTRATICNYESGRQEIPKTVELAMKQLELKK